VVKTDDHVFLGITKLIALLLIVILLEVFEVSTIKVFLIL